MKYRNPVIAGFYPDPSICRVGEDFYLVNSTFEFFPAVPIMHSRDLVHWKQIGHCITRDSQLTLHKDAAGQNGTGIFAPTIRYHEGIFYMIVTNVGSGDGTGNFYIWTKDPAGEWSDPVFLDAPGIDPSLFFDEDGRVYYTGTNDTKIYLQELDLKAGKLLGKPKEIWGGSGGAYAEGPHLYRKDGWYYLLISEGGTERCHMLTMARSKNVEGPYDPCPHNPVMTNRSLGLPIESVGHADLVQDQHGRWWAVCLGTRPLGYPPRHNLGRETMLLPVDWSGEWPVFGDHGRVLEEFEVEALPDGRSGQCTAEGQCSGPDFFEDDFQAGKPDFSWNYLYNPDEALFEYRKEGLCLHGNENCLKDADSIAWIGRRQQHHVSETCVTLTFPVSLEGEEAGLTVYMNCRHHYEAALCCENQKRKLIFRRQIGSLEKVECEVEDIPASVRLKLTSDKEFYIFSYQTRDGSWKELGRGEVQYLTTEVGGRFTGNYIALYAGGNGRPCREEAVFSDFVYSGRS